MYGHTIYLLNKPAEAVRKTAAVNLGNLYVWQNMQKNFFKIEPLSVAKLLTKIDQKLVIS